ncbi:MAG: YcxB family protein [Ferruginibacter sp.]
MISFRFSLTPDDFANYSIYVQLEAPGKKKLIFKRFWPLIIVMSLVFFIDILNGFLTDKFDNTFIIGIPVFAFILLSSAFSLKPRIKKLALKFSASADNISVFRMTDYTFSETGVITKDDVKEIQFQWAAFIKKAETTHYFYLFLHSTSALIIPKRIFRSQVEKDLFTQLLSAHISFDAEIGHLVKQ